MTTYLLDTNHCSRLTDNDPEVLQRTRMLPVEDELVTTVTVAGELFFMVARSERQADNRVQVEALLERLRMLDLDTATSQQYGTLKARLLAHFAPRRRRAGLQLANIGISENDAWIAAAALRWDATVVSADSDFTRIREAVPELVLVSW